VKAKRAERLAAVRCELERILDDAGAFEERYRVQLEQLHPEQLKSGLNLLHYLALRHRDSRDLQSELGVLGLSSLGRAEAHVLANVHAVLHAVRALQGRRGKPRKGPVTFKQGKKLIRRHTRALLGKKVKGSPIRIMVTLPSEAADDYRLIRDILVAGANCVRINCAHDGPDQWERMLAHVERARRATGRSCRTFMDVCGPKIRTGPLAPGPKVVRIHPAKDVRGNILGPEIVTLAPVPGAGLIPVSPELFAHLEPGSRISFRDARDKRGRIDVTCVENGRAKALCAATAYVETGLALELVAEDGTVRCTGEVGDLPDTEDPIVLRVGDVLVVHKDPRPGEPARPGCEGRPAVPAHVSCTLPELLDDVRPGEPLLLDDGKIHGVIREVRDGEVTVEITGAKPGGTPLRGDKGINLPESALRIAGLTAKDKEDLRFIAAHADGVSASFVNHPDDVEDLLDELDAVGGDELGLILKIETRRGFQHLPGILLVAMERPAVGVMIARGDLAVEAGWTHLAQIQEEILWVCEAAHVPVVWATQVLEKLAKTGLPTRSEISDVAMAQRAECVMLNKGPFITEAIRTLDHLLRSVQGYQRKKATLLPALTLEEPDPEEVGRSVGTRQGRTWLR
jgi:pyruvate kinase